jgi:hypothetical protein
VVEIAKICAYVNNSLFFVNRDEVGDPRSVGNGVNEPNNA